MHGDTLLEKSLKVVFGPLFALAIAAWLWRLLVDEVGGLVADTFWPWFTSPPWWLPFAGAGGLCGVVLVALLLPSARPTRGAPAAPGWEEPSFDPAQFARMSPTAFEEACAELLVRDGFLDVRRVGGSGDLGADVLARDGEGRRVVVQCKRYLSPVGSGHLQRFNGTAVPEHGADLAVMVGLSGFTAPARAFAARHGIALVGDEELARWAVGTPLGAVLARPPDGGG